MIARPIDQRDCRGHRGQCLIDQRAGDAHPAPLHPAAGRGEDGDRLVAQDRESGPLENLAGGRVDLCGLPFG